MTSANIYDAEWLGYAIPLEEQATNFLDKKNLAIDESNQKIVESEKKIGAERQKVAKTIGLIKNCLQALTE